MSAFFRSLRSPGCDVDAQGRYTYRDPESGAVHDVHWLFGWLYLWTPAVLLGFAGLMLLVLVLGIATDWARHQAAAQRAKDRATGEVMVDAREAEARRARQYDGMDTPTLRKRKAALEAKVQHTRAALAETTAELAALPTTDETAVERRRLTRRRSRLTAVAENDEANVRAMPPIYEAVRPRFWGEYA